MNKRFKLYEFRKKKNLTQSEFAAKIGVSTSCYTLIELGQRNGTTEFWLSLQNTFDVPDAMMWELMKIEK